MNAKYFLKPTKWKMLIFFILFVVIYIIPYFKVTGYPECQACIFQTGHYSLIAGFFIQLIFIQDWLMGNFILNEFIGFIGYLISFVVVYAISCCIVASFKKYFARKNNNHNSE
jgi:hypothetical protein